MKSVLWILTILVSLLLAVAIGVAALQTKEQTVESAPSPVIVEVTRVITVIPPTATPTSTPLPTPTIPPPTPSPTYKPFYWPTWTPTPPPTSTPTPTATPTRAPKIITRSKKDFCNCKPVFNQPGVPTPTFWFDAPTPTPNHYTVSYKKYMYSAPKYDVTDIPICFEEHTHRDDGKTYTRDARYRVQYKDREGKRDSLTLTFSLFNRGQRNEYIQAYETVSEGSSFTHDTDVAQALEGIKRGTYKPTHKGRCK